MDKYWEYVLQCLDARKTEEQYHNFFLFEISIQENTLIEYEKKLEANPYTENTIAVNEQKIRLAKLQEVYRQFKRNIEIDPTEIEPIQLPYGIKNRQVIKLLHKGLYPKFIQCSLEEFKKHFSEQESYNPIQWLGTQTIIADLFKNILKPDNDWATSIVNHFIKKDGSNFNRDQTVSISSVRANGNYPNKEIIAGIASEISNL